MQIASSVPTAVADTFDTARYSALCDPPGGGIMVRVWRAARACVVGALVGWNSVATGQESGNAAPSPSGEPASADPSGYFAQDSDFQFASLLQQPGAAPSLATSTPASSRPQPSSRRLTSVPNMFGDLGLTTCISVLVSGDPNGGPTRIVRGMADIPLGGAGRTGKLAENDVALPVDRIFASYNHYHNILTLTEETQVPAGGTTIVKNPIDRYTVGFEKTYMDGWGSVEVRMPFNGSFDSTLGDTSVNGGNVGNLSVILKSLLYRDDDLGIGVGLAIDSPTGSDVESQIGGTNILIQNEALHLLPYVGFLYSAGDPQFGWGEGLFMSGFAQVDVAANGNTVLFTEFDGAPIENVGKLNEQTLLYLDLAVGYWLYRDSEAPRLTGVAVVGETHYTTTLQDADIIFGTDPSANLLIGNVDNRFDVVNGTIGLQFLFFDLSSLRVAGVFPLGDQPHERFFDSEVQVQFNRQF